MYSIKNCSHFKGCYENTKKGFMIVNYSGQYYKTIITIVSYAPNLALALAGVINYDRK
jgi:hypothetical protein